MSGNQSSTFNPPPEVTPPPEQPEVPPVPEIPEVPPPVQDNPAPSETITPPEQFADPPRHEVPQPDPANFQVCTLHWSLLVGIYNNHCFSSAN